jgi:hypothetical protein
LAVLAVLTCPPGTRISQRDNQEVVRYIQRGESVSAAETLGRTSPIDLEKLKALEENVAALIAGGRRARQPHRGRLERSVVAFEQRDQTDPDDA